MASDFFDFHWRIPEDGYSWTEMLLVDDRDSSLEPVPGKPGYYGIRKSKGNPGQRAWLLTEQNYKEGAWYLRYDPLEEYPALFREFASLSLKDRDGLLGFANRYGCLGLPIVHGLVAADTPGQFHLWGGEPLDEWLQQIYFMRQAMTLWDLVSRKDKAALSRYIRWQEGGDGVRAGWIYFPDPEEPAPDKPLLPQGGQTSRGHFFIEEALDLFRADDVLMPALFTVQRWINSHLNEFAFPKLLCDPKKIRQGLFIVPRTLLGAIWLQFAQAVAGNKKYRACKECGEWFEVGKDGDARTARREFCSDICKSRDYRHRKEQARRLKAEGASLKDIAKELGTDLETIKKWVAKRKG